MPKFTITAKLLLVQEKLICFTLSKVNKVQNMLISVWTNAVMFTVNAQNVSRWLQRRLSVACAMHWSHCQSLPNQDGRILPRHAGAALPRPWSCGACTHDLVGSPHHVVDGVQIRTVWRPQRERNEKNLWELRGRNCFWNTNILDFQISQGSVATQLRWGGNLYKDLQKISYGISQWKNCENRCSFAEVMTKKQSGCFSGTLCTL